MALIQIDTNDVQDTKIGIVKAVKKLKSKEESVLLMIDEYSIDKVMKEVKK